MRSFDSLSEKEILALAISQEEEDARIYDDFADGLKENHPEQARQFSQMRREEDSHRHRLLELYRTRSASTCRCCDGRTSADSSAAGPSGWSGRWD